MNYFKAFSNSLPFLVKHKIYETFKYKGNHETCEVDEHTNTKSWCTIRCL